MANEQEIARLRQLLQQPNITPNQRLYWTQGLQKLENENRLAAFDAATASAETPAASSLDQRLAAFDKAQPRPTGELDQRLAAFDAARPVQPTPLAPSQPLSFEQEAEAANQGVLNPEQLKSLLAGRTEAERPLVLEHIQRQVRNQRAGELIAGGLVSGLPFVGGKIAEALEFPKPETAGEQLLSGAAQVPTAIAGFGGVAHGISRLTRLGAIAKSAPTVHNMATWGLAASAISGLNTDDRDLYDRLKDAGVAGVESALLARVVTPTAKKALALLKKGQLPQYSRWNLAGRFGIFGLLRTGIFPETGAAPISPTGIPSIDAALWDAAVASVYAHGKPKPGDRMPVAIAELTKAGREAPQWTLAEAEILSKQRKFNRDYYRLKLDDGSIQEWTYGKTITRVPQEAPLQETATVNNQHLRHGDIIQWRDKKAGNVVGIVRGFHTDPTKPRDINLLVTVPDRLGTGEGGIAWVTANRDVRILDEKAKADWLASQPGPEGPPPEAPPATPGAVAPAEGTLRPGGGPFARMPAELGFTPEEINASLQATRRPPEESAQAAPGTPQTLRGAPRDAEFFFGPNAADVVMKRAPDYIGPLRVYHDSDVAQHIGKELVERLLRSMPESDIERFRQMRLKFVFQNGGLAGAWGIAHYPTRTILVDISPEGGLFPALPGRPTLPSSMDRALLTLAHEIEHQESVTNQQAWTPEAIAFQDAVGWQPLTNFTGRISGVAQRLYSGGRGTGGLFKADLPDGNTIHFVAEDQWARPATPAEIKEPRLSHFRRNAAEDLADTTAWFAQNPDTLKELDPVRYDAFLKFLTPRIIRGVTQTAEGQLLLFGPQVRPPAGQPAAPPPEQALPGTEGQRPLPGFAESRPPEVISRIPIARAEPEPGRPEEHITILRVDYSGKRLEPNVGPLIGRRLTRPISDPVSGRKLGAPGQVVTREMAGQISRAGIERVQVMPLPGRPIPVSGFAESRPPRLTPEDRLARIFEAINTETDPARKAEMTSFLENVYQPINDMIARTAQAKGVDVVELLDAALPEALKLGQRGAGGKTVSDRIAARADDLLRKRGTVISGGGAVEEAIEGGTDVGVAGARTKRIRGRLLGTLQNLKGTPEGQLRIAEALGRIQDAGVRDALQLAAGVDINGRPTGNPLPLGEAAKRKGVSLRQIQEAIKVDPSGTFIVKAAQQAAAAAAKTEAARALGIPKKEAADPIGAVIAQARSIDEALTKAPSDPKLQRRASELRRKLAALAAQGPSLTPEQRAALKAAGYDPDAVQKGMDAEHPAKEEPAETPAAQPGLKFPSSNQALAIEWKNLVDRIPRSAAGQQAFVKAIERAKALEVEMRRRGIQFEPSGGMPRGAPPKGGSTKTARRVPEPVVTGRDFIVETVPELDPYAIDEARLKGDYAPTRIVIRRASDKVIIGNYSSRTLRPQFWAQTRFKVESFGFRPKVSEPPVGARVLAGLVPGASASTPEFPVADRTFRYRLTDRLTGEEVGFFTADQLRRFMAGRFVPGITTDPESGEMLPSARDVADDIRNTPKDQQPPAARMGTHDLKDAEFMNMPGEQQTAHIMQAVDNAKTADAAWAAVARYSGLTHEYPNRQRDVEALYAHASATWGTASPRYAGNHELLQILNKIDSSYRNSKREGVLHWKDYESMDLGGTGKAYDPARVQQRAESFVQLVDRLLKPTVAAGDEITLPDDGRLTWMASRSLMGPTRQHYFFGHPVAADLHLKARFAALHEAARNAHYGERLGRALEGVSVPQDIAIRLWLEGRHQAHQTMGVPTVLIHRDLTTGAPLGGTDVRVAIDKLRALFTGSVPLTKILIPEMTPDLQRRALEIRQVMTEIADEAGLPYYQRFEQYFPHFWRKLGIGDLTYYDLPFDLNIGSEVFFRFFQPRHHPDLHNYEVGTREVLDVYVRGAMRKAAFDPLVEEFNSAGVRDVLPNKQRQYMQEFLRHVIGEPSTDDQLIAQGLRAILGESPSWGGIKWLRRAILASDRPAFQLAQIIRGWQFLRTLGFNAGFLATNLQQAPLTYAMRHKWSGYIDTLAKSGVFRESVISKYFDASHTAGEVRRSDLALGIQATKGYISKGLEHVGNIVQSTEVVNRRQSFTGGFKVAKEAGLMDGDAVAAGIIESDLTQFNMTKTGRLPMTRSPFGSVMFQFLQYNIEMGNLIGHELYNATGARGRPLATQAWTRLTKLGLAFQLLGGVNAHIGPFLQLIHRVNATLFGEQFDGEFDEFLHMLDVASADYLFGMMVRGRPFETGHRINPINLVYKFGSSVFGPAIGQVQELVDKFRGAPGAPTTGQLVVRGAPFGVAAERAFGDTIERYALEPPARALGLRPKDIKLKQGRDVTERILGREPAPKKGAFRSDPTALRKILEALDIGRQK